MSQAPGEARVDGAVSGGAGRARPGDEEARGAAHADLPPGGSALRRPPRHGRAHAGEGGHPREYHWWLVGVVLVILLSEGLRPKDRVDLELHSNQVLNQMSAEM